MPSSVKSSTYVESNTKTLQELKLQLEVHNKVIEKNTKQLAKINARSEEMKADKAKELMTELKRLETEIQWVKNEEPALKVDSEHLMKRLNIL